MNIEQARKKIKRAQLINTTTLSLFSYEDIEELNSEDLSAILPEIKKVRNLRRLYRSYEHIDNFLDNVRLIERERKQEEKTRTGDTYNFYGNTQLSKDHSTGHQHNYGSQEIEKALDSINSKYESKLDEILSKQDETKTDYEKTKTKLENLPQKFRDQIDIAVAKGKELFGYEFQTNELDESRTKGEPTG